MLTNCEVKRCSATHGIYVDAADGTLVPLPVQDLTDFALTQALVLTFQRRLYLCYQSSQPPKINDVEQYY